VPSTDPQNEAEAPGADGVPEVSRTADQDVIPPDELEDLETTAPDPDDIELAVRSEPLEDEDGNEVIVAQQNMGVEGSIGQGEFPSRHTPPKGPAPGQTN
jgi:hypothetical protein